MIKPYKVRTYYHTYCDKCENEIKDTVFVIKIKFCYQKGNQKNKINSVKSIELCPECFKKCYNENNLTDLTYDMLYAFIDDDKSHYIKVDGFVIVTRKVTKSKVTNIIQK